MEKRNDTQRILIVDDDESACQLLMSILNSEQRTLMVARTLAEAKEVLKQKRVDLLLLDLYLPDGSGLDLISELRKNPLPLPVVIMMTAFGSWESHVKSYNLGAYYFLDKPFKATQLRTLVKAGLEKRSVPPL